MHSRDLIETILLERNLAWDLFSSSTSKHFIPQNHQFVGNKPDEDAQLVKDNYLITRKREAHWNKWVELRDLYEYATQPDEVRCSECRARKYSFERQVIGQTWDNCKSCLYCSHLRETLHQKLKEKFHQ